MRARGSPPEKGCQFDPWQAVKNRRSFQPGASRLIDAATDQSEFAGAVRIGRDGNSDAGSDSGTRVFRRKIEPVRARINLEETSVLPRLRDDTRHIDFVARALQQEASGRVSQNVEVPVVHRP